MKRFGKELKFISRIDGEGLNIYPVDRPDVDHLDEELFRMRCLSISNKTWIASGFHSFVVKLNADFNLTKK